jgi:hypothetical protein
MLYSGINLKFCNRFCGPMGNSPRWESKSGSSGPRRYKNWQAIAGGLRDRPGS